MSWVGERRITLQVHESEAGRLTVELNGRFGEREGSLVAVDARQRVNLLVVDASLRDVVASLLAAGVVRVERP